MNTVIVTISAKVPPGLLESLTEPGKYLVDLPVKIARKRFAGRICRADLPGQPNDPARL